MNTSMIHHALTTGIHLQTEKSNAPESTQRTQPSDEFLTQMIIVFTGLFMHKHQFH